MIVKKRKKLSVTSSINLLLYACINKSFFCLESLEKYDVVDKKSNLDWQLQFKKLSQQSQFKKCCSSFWLKSSGFDLKAYTDKYNYICWGHLLLK